MKLDAIFSFLTVVSLLAVCAMAILGFAQRDEARDQRDVCSAASELWKQSAQYALKGDIYAANDAGMAAEVLGCEVTS